MRYTSIILRTVKRFNQQRGFNKFAIIRLKLQDYYCIKQQTSRVAATFLTSIGAKHKTHTMCDRIDEYFDVALKLTKTAGKVSSLLCYLLHKCMLISIAAHFRQNLYPETCRNKIW